MRPGIVNLASMKKLVVLPLIVGLTQLFAQSEWKKLEWLEGSWIRIDGRRGLETWKRKASSEWLGVGMSIHDRDTTVTERIRLIEKEGTIFYEADVKENEAPVRFRMTAIGERHFVCENPEHDFPKKISYDFDGAVLRATISGNGRSVEYKFQRAAQR